MGIVKEFWRWMMGPVFDRQRESDTARVRRALEQEAFLATEFSNFMSAAVNRGYDVKVRVEVDGVVCTVGLLLYSQEPLVEYMANWAVNQKMAKYARLEDFEEQCGLNRYNGGKTVDPRQHWGEGEE